jgi:spermidine synthase
VTYYHPTGPIGQLFDAFSGDKMKKHYAVVGLGTGTLASYGQAGQAITFYEIDPTVVRLSGPEGKFFTFVQKTPAKVDIVMGDARLRLADAPDKQYGFIFLDAFSSDAIPIHLITREALELYMKKLTDDGIVVFHISNRYLDLEPVLGNLAENLGLVGIVQYDRDEEPTAKSSSHWVLISKKRENFGKLAEDERWTTLKPDHQKVGIWTDDFSNIVSVFDWE